MPPFIARIGWSGNGLWDGPSIGGGGGETPGSFRHDVGFGFEDWFLDFRHALSDGYVYSMLQPVYKSRKARSGQVLDLLVYTISPDGRRFYVGRLLAAQVLTPAEAQTAVDGFAKPPLPGFFRVPRRRPHFRRAARAVAFCAARSSASRSRYEFASILTTSAQCVSRSTSVTTHAAFGKMSPHS